MEENKSGVSLIETEELNELIKSGQNNLKLVCASWYIGKDQPDPIEKFDEAHIAGSVYFSISEIANKSTGLLATLQEKEDFTREMRRLGIKKSDTVVVYEHDRIYVSPRVSWMLRIHGHKDVRILNGCLKKWIEEGRPTATGKPEDVNDVSEDGYDYERNDSMYDSLRTVLRKAYSVKGKFNNLFQSLYRGYSGE